MKWLAMLWLILHHIFSSRGTTHTDTDTESAELESKQQGASCTTPEHVGPVGEPATTAEKSAHSVVVICAAIGVDDVDTMVNYIRDSLEAAARKLMAEQHIARGWDTARERGQWLADVDAALDAYNEAASVEA